MSTIGSAGIGALNIAGSVAGTQRTNADTNQVRQNAAHQKAAADRNAASEQTLGDVGQTDESADRDPDGRLPWKAPPEADGSEDGDESTDRASGRTSEALDERGNRLDLRV